MTQPLRPIESADNPFFKSLTKILTGRGIRKHGTALVSGPKVVEEFLRRSPESCLAWINTARQPGPPLDLPDTVAWYQLSGALFREVDVVGTNAPMLLVKTPEMASWNAADGFAPGCNLLVPFQDPENVGSVIRTAAAFGVTSVILLAECAHPYHPKALRASAGAVFQVTLLEGPSLADLPPDLPVVALSPEGRDIHGADFPDAFGLLPGIEGPGLPHHFRDESLSIPLADGVESLNSATATAIVLYLWRRSQE